MAMDSDTALIIITAKELVIVNDVDDDDLVNVNWW